MCEMDKIMDLANKYNLKVIEDCAQSHGAPHTKVKKLVQLEMWVFFLSYQNFWCLWRRRLYYYNDEQT